MFIGTSVNRRAIGESVEIRRGTANNAVHAIGSGAEANGSRERGSIALPQLTNGSDRAPHETPQTACEGTASTFTRYSASPIFFPHRKHSNAAAISG